MTKSQDRAEFEAEHHPAFDNALQDAVAWDILHALHLMLPGEQGTPTGWADCSDAQIARVKRAATAAIARARPAPVSGFREGLEAAAKSIKDKWQAQSEEEGDVSAGNSYVQNVLGPGYSAALGIIRAAIRSLPHPTADDGVVERVAEVTLRAERAEAALRIIRDFPIPEQDNLLATSMRELARAAISAIQGG